MPTKFLIFICACFVLAIPLCAETDARALTQRPDGTLIAAPGSIPLSDPAFGGTLPTARLPVGKAAETVAAGNDARLLAAPRVVPTVAALRALPPPVAGQDSGHVIVQGYRVPGDGGGGEYAWDPAAVGRLTGIFARSIFHLGAGYVNRATIKVSAPPAGGTQATVSCEVSQQVQGNWHGQAVPAGTLTNLTITNPGSGYTSAPTITVSPTPSGAGAFPAELSALGDWDDGGYCLASSVPGAQGRWRAVDVKPGTVNLLRFGWKINDPTEADNNSLCYEHARQALPALIDTVSQGVTCGASWLDEPVACYQGSILFPDGASYVGRKLVVTPYMSLVSGHNGTTLLAKDRFAPDAQNPAYMLRLAVNSEYDNTAYPARPTFHVNTTYQCTLNGHFTLVGRYGANNHGARGCDLQGAQGCGVFGELETTDMGSGGMLTNFSADKLTSLGGKNPLIHYYGSVGNRVGQVDVEHGTSDPDYPADAEGDPHRFLRVEASQNVQISYLACEAFDPQNLCVVNGATVSIASCAQNTMQSLFLVKGGGSNLTVHDIQSVGQVHSGHGQLWIEDRTHGVNLPPGTPSYVRDFNAANTLSENGHRVLTQAFVFPQTAGRFRLRAEFWSINSYLLNTRKYLVTMQDGGDTQFVCLLTFAKAFDGQNTQTPVQARVQVLEGGGALPVVTTVDSTEPLTGGAAKKVTADLAWVKPGGRYTTISVVNLGGTDIPSGITWSAVPETQSDVLDGKAAAAVFSPLAGDGAQAIGVFHPVAKPAAADSPGRAGDVYLDPVNHRAVWYMPDGSGTNWFQQSVTAYMP